MPPLVCKSFLKQSNGASVVRREGFGDVKFALDIATVQPRLEVQGEG